MGAVHGAGSRGAGVHGVPARRRRLPRPRDRGAGRARRRPPRGVRRGARPLGAPAAREVAAQTAAGLLHPVYAGSAATGAGVPELMAGHRRPAPGPRTRAGRGAPSGRVFKVERGVGRGEGRLRPDVHRVGAGAPAPRPARGTRRQGRRASSSSRPGTGSVPTEVGAGQIAPAARARRGPGRRRLRRPVRRRRAPLRPAHARGVGDGGTTRAGPGPAGRAGALADQDPLIDARTDDDGHVVGVALRPGAAGGARGRPSPRSTASRWSSPTPACSTSSGRAGAGRAVELLNTDTNPYHATIGLRIAPAHPGSGLSFDDRGAVATACRSSSSRAPRRSPPSCERHVARALEHGLFGWQVTDCRVTADRHRATPPATARRRRAARCRRPSTTASSRRSSCARLWPARATRVCEPVLRVVARGADRRARRALQRLLGRWGAELADQTSRGDYATLEARLPAARLHELQRQLPDLTGGEGVLESRFDGYQPVRGRAPRRRSRRRYAVRG